MAIIFELWHLVAKQHLHIREGFLVVATYFSQKEFLLSVFMLQISQSLVLVLLQDVELFN